tara:strand:+ start:140 stop:442 length:303 start_codon:yes stop_codon:yes gene_type:complete
MSISFQRTIDDIKDQIRKSGGSLTKLPSAERAQKLHDWLKKKLPRHLDVWIIDAPGRENEVNVFTIGKFDSRGDFNRSPGRSSKAVKVPARVRRWIKDTF